MSSRLSLIRALDFDVARSGADDGGRRAQEARSSSEYEPAREPFHRSHGEISEPRGRRKQLEGPDSNDDGELARSIHIAEEPKAMTVEDRRANHRL